MLDPSLKAASRNVERLRNVEPAELQSAAGAKLLALPARKFGRCVDAGASAADIVRVAAPGSFEATSHPLAISAAVGAACPHTGVRKRH
jgi:hypothetical protein